MYTIYYFIINIYFFLEKKKVEVESCVIWFPLVEPLYLRIIGRQITCFEVAKFDGNGDFNSTEEKDKSYFEQINVAKIL